MSRPLYTVIGSNYHPVTDSGNFSMEKKFEEHVRSEEDAMAVVDLLQDRCLWTSVVTVTQRADVRPTDLWRKTQAIAGGK